MALILGLDVATTTGLAWYEPSSSLSSIKADSIKAIGTSPEEKAESLAQQLVTVLKAERPDFVAIEEPLRNIKAYKKTIQTLYGPKVIHTVNPNQMLLYALIGAVVSIIGAYRLPWQTIPPATWRKSFFGAGFKPPVKITHKDGEDPQEEKLWKKAARDRCNQLKIKVTNDDMAEAVGIAFAASKTQTFKMRSMRAAA